MNILSINKADLVGGAGQLAYNLNTELVSRGHKVASFVCDKSSQNTNVQVIPRSKSIFYLSHLLGTDINLFKTDYILETPEFKQADIIHCHNLHGHYFNLSTLAKMAKLKPVVWTLHDMWALTPYCSHSFSAPDAQGFYSCTANSSKSWCKRRNWRFLRGSKADLYKELDVDLVVPSLWLQSKLEASVLMDKKHHLIHNGINLASRPDRKQSSQLRQKLGLPLDKKIVLFVASGGKDNIWKGWTYAEQVITAYQNRLDTLFVCIGGDKSVDNNPHNLLFVDYLADKRLLAEYYACADAFLLSSTAESFALVVLEAMFAGLPIVSFAVGAVPELIIHRTNGYIAQYLDSQDLIAGLNFVLDLDESAMSNILSNNQVLVSNHFSLSSMTSRYLELYQTILQSH